ncbi:MAG: hypothetical protein KDC44_14435, partial [Phaeodactylibacter sp.]|nr:hypothetical protein [Phaeodactylibacter sp.]
MQIHQASTFVKSMLVLGCCAIFCTASLTAQQANTVMLKWLGDQAPALQSGVSWGVPFAEGTVSPSSAFRLKNSAGQAQQVQTWPMAYWPDGSIKWIGVSTVVPPEADSVFYFGTVKKAAVVNTGHQIQLTESKDRIQINTGAIQCELPRSG